MKDKYYYGKCGGCYYSVEDRNGKIYCTEYKKYYWKDTDASNCRYYKSGYVTSAVCDILGRHEYKNTLDKIKELRTVIMESDEDYDYILDRYDNIGPKIAKMIIDKYKIDKDSSLAKNLFDFYIEPTVQMYEKEDYFGAIEMYSKMEDVLESTFGFIKEGYTNVGQAKLIKDKKKRNN